MRHFCQQVASKIHHRIKCNFSTNVRDFYILYNFLTYMEEILLPLSEFWKLNKNYFSFLKSYGQLNINYLISIFEPPGMFIILHYLHYSRFQSLPVYRNEKLPVNSTRDVCIIQKAAKATPLTSKIQAYYTFNQQQTLSSDDRDKDWDHVIKYLRGNSITPHSTYNRVSLEYIHTSAGWQTKRIYELQHSAGNSRLTEQG